MLLKLTQVVPALMLVSSAAAAVIPMVGGADLEVLIAGTGLQLNLQCLTGTATTNAPVAATTQQGLAPICPGLTNKRDIAGSAAGEAGCVRCRLISHSGLSLVCMLTNYQT